MISFSMASKAFLFVLLTSLLLGSAWAAKGACKQITLDFIVKENHAQALVIEDDIRKDLAKIGITVNTIALDEEAYRDAELHGHYHLMFTSGSWGAPYDPHTYLNSWKVPAHVEYSAIGNLEPPMTRDKLLEMIEAVQIKSDPKEIAEGWEEIQRIIHEQAMFLPLWGNRIPYVLNRRFAGFVPSAQNYEYPLQSISVLSGSKTVTIAPGAGGSLFESTGPINPHQYFPNQLFAQRWVYEGLVGYGQDGEIIPVLATSWVIEDTAGGGNRFTFTLREGVKFHDGSDWNCRVAKLNFDHVLSDVVRERHQWMGAVTQLTSWTCVEEKFVLETKEKYYPLLQELTYIRPLTFAAATAFAKGFNSDPDTHNSCNPGDFGGKKWDHLEQNITCAGLKPYGTGPFKVVNVEEGVFARHSDYWGQVPDIESLHLKKYDSTDAVEKDLLSGKLDMALGVGPLSPEQVQRIKFYNSDVVDVRHSDVMQNAVLMMNLNADGTKDIEVRRAIIHAIDKARFIKEEFAGLEQPADQLFPYSTPYCNIDLSPKWAYDFEKAELLNCPGLPVWGTVLIVIFSVAFAAVVGILGVMYYREKRGQPIFMPIPPVPTDLTRVDGAAKEAVIGNVITMPIAPTGGVPVKAV